MAANAPLINSSIKSLLELENFVKHDKQKDKLIVIAISATWSLTYESVDEMMKKYADKYKDDQVVFVNIDYDESEDVARRYRVRYLPTFVLTKGGRDVAKVAGAKGDELEKKILQYKAK